MFIEVLKSKIHRIKVTDGNLDYIGSLTLDIDLMEKVGLVHGEKIQVLNVNNGERLETYVIEGESDSQDIVINGAAAHKIKTGEKVIIVSYALFKEEEADSHTPTLVYVDEENNLKK